MMNTLRNDRTWNGGCETITRSGKRAGKLCNNRFYKIRSIPNGCQLKSCYMHPSKSKILSFILYPIFKYCEYLSKHNPKKLVKIRYWLRFHKKLDLEDPKDINEKIQWLKFNSDMNVWGRLSDKYVVREYLKECGLGSILNDLYAKWDDVNDIDLNILPNSFVLK